MRTMSWKFVSWMGALALVLTMVPGAVAQCSFPGKTVKPSVWHPQYGEGHLTLVAGHDDGYEAPSIVGMWHVVFTAQTGPITGVIDNSVVVWHSDGTEIMNSSRPAQDGNFCLGVWKQTGKLKYYLNHIPWQGNDTSGGPYGIGSPQGGVQLTEKVTLSSDGNAYSGTFTLTAYDTSGSPTVTFTGVLSAKRITTETPFTDLF